MSVRGVIALVNDKGDYSRSRVRLDSCAQSSISAPDRNNRQ